MLKFTEKQVTEFLAEQHRKWFKVLADRTLNLGYERLPVLPSYSVADAVFDNCGNYNFATNHIQYSLPFAAYEGEVYAETVAHEMCHAFIPVVATGAPTHGSMFLWLLRDACKFPNAQVTGAYTYESFKHVLEAEKELTRQRGGLRNMVAFRRTARSLKEMRGQ